MTIGEYTQVYRGKKVVDFKMGGSAVAGDVAYRLMQEYDSDESQEELLAKSAELAADKTVNGILVQLPLPKQIDERAVIDAIPPEKDVDAWISMMEKKMRG